MLRFAWLWLVLLAAATAALGHAARRLSFDFDLEKLLSSHGEELRLYHEFSDRHGREDLTVYAAFRTDDLFDRETRKKVRDLRKRLLAIGGVAAVVSYDELAAGGRLAGMSEQEVREALTSSPAFVGTFLDGRGRTAVIHVQLRDPASRDATLAQIRQELGRTDFGGPIHLAGIPTIETEYIRLMKRDLARFTPITLGVFLVLLACYFRNVVGTLLPLAAVLTGVVWLLGAMVLAGRPISALTTIVPNLMLVIGISDAIHILSRYRQDRSIAAAVKTMAWPCFLTSFTSAVGFASLLATDSAVVREFGAVAAVGIMIQYAAVMTVVPLVLSVVPQGRPRPAAGPSRFLRALAAVSERGRPAVIGLSAVTMAACGWLMLRIEWNASWLQDLSAENEVYRAHEFIEDNVVNVFSVELSLTAAEPGGFGTLSTLEALDAFEARLRADPRVSTVVGGPDFLREMMRLESRQARLPESQQEYDRLRGRLGILVPMFGSGVLDMVVDRTFTHARVTVRSAARMEARGMEEIVAFILTQKPADGAFSVQPTGKSWLAKKSLDGVIRNMAASLGLAAAVISLVMALMFGSLRTGLISMIPNFMPMAVTAGLMGALAIDLNFTTITVFSISLGLAVDNTIHFLSRYRSEIAVDGDRMASIYRAMEGVGRPMIFSTALLLLGFGAILTSNFRFTFYFGLLGGATMVAALLGDLFVLPVLIVLLKPRVRTLREFLIRKT